MYFIILRAYLAFEFALLVFFLTHIIRNHTIKKIFLISIVPYLFFSIYNFYTSDTTSFNNYPAIVEFSVFIVLLVFYFYEKMNIISTIPLLNSISFWLCVGLFIYFTGNLFYLLFITSTKDPELQIQMQTIYSAVTIIKNLIISSAWFATETINKDADIIQLPENMNLDDDFTFTNTTNP